MRLREPFQGYKLSSGHFMFHMAYLIGSIIATKYVLEYPTKEEIDQMGAEEFKDFQEAHSVLLQLNIAHILVPIFNAMSLICNKNDSYVMEKIFDTISIFQY